MAAPSASQYYDPALPGPELEGLQGPQRPAFARLLAAAFGLLALCLALRMQSEATTRLHASPVPSSVAVARQPLAARSDPQGRVSRRQAGLTGVLAAGSLVATRPAAAISGGGKGYSGQNLEYEDFSQQDLTNVEFRGVRAKGIKFVGARLQNAQFQKADLRLADFTGADLTGAALELCPMDGAILRNAILEGAYLSDAMLDVEDIEGADFTDAILPTNCARPRRKGVRLRTSNHADPTPSLRRRGGTCSSSCARRPAA
eukprot:EG_transcript_21625